MSAPDPTYPHDYRVICAGQPPPVIIGGQAVNLWAISYLDPDAGHQSTRYGSTDLDILGGKDVIARLKSLAGWSYRRNSLLNFLDARVGLRWLCHPMQAPGRRSTPSGRHWFKIKDALKSLSQTSRSAL